MNSPNAATVDLVRGAGDQLDKIRQLVRQLRDHERRIEDLKAMLVEENKALTELKYKTLVDAMQEAGVDTLGLPPEGNQPGYTAQLEPFYRANIPVSWPHEKKEAAYDWYEEHGHGDLMKVRVTADFGQREIEQARELERKLLEMKLHATVDVARTIHHMTNTAWLREQVEKYHRTPPLELLGAQVGSVVKLMPRKD